MKMNRNNEFKNNNFMIRVLRNVSNCDFQISTFIHLFICLPVI